jgi:hypothetical protein
MPIYIYQNPETGEVKEIMQSMNDIHEYFEKNVKWNRIFTVPQASIDTNADPFNSNQFLDVTKNKKGTYGNMLDYSKELSEKRSKISGGPDPIKDKYYEQYAKDRGGSKHPDTFKKVIENKNVKVEL